jgi:hypothetical protein
LTVGLATGEQVRSRIRTLHLGEQIFTWKAEIGHIRGSTDCHRCIRVRAWADGKASQALQVDLLSTYWPAPWGPCATDNAYPTSADIRAIVVYALAHGWEPARRGGTWQLTERDAQDLELPDFLVTEGRLLPTVADPTARVVAEYQRRLTADAAHPVEA